MRACLLAEALDLGITGLVRLVGPRCPGQLAERQAGPHPPPGTPEQLTSVVVNPARRAETRKRLIRSRWLLPLAYVLIVILVAGIAVLVVSDGRRSPSGSAQKQSQT